MVSEVFSNLKDSINLIIQVDNLIRVGIPRNLVLLSELSVAPLQPLEGEEGLWCGQEEALTGTKPHLHPSRELEHEDNSLLCSALSGFLPFLQIRFGEFF